MRSLPQGIVIATGAAAWLVVSLLESRLLQVIGPRGEMSLGSVALLYLVWVFSAFGVVRLFIVAGASARVWIGVAVAQVIGAVGSLVLTVGPALSGDAGAAAFGLVGPVVGSAFVVAAAYLGSGAGLVGAASRFASSVRESRAGRPDTWE